MKFYNKLPNTETWVQWDSNDIDNLDWKTDICIILGAFALFAAAWGILTIFTWIF